MHSTEKSAVFSLEFSTSHDSWIFELIEIDIDIAQQLGALLWSTGNLGLQDRGVVLNKYSSLKRNFMNTIEG